LPDQYSITDLRLRQTQKSGRAGARWFEFGFVHYEFMTFDGDLNVCPARERTAADCMMSILRLLAVLLRFACGWVPSAARPTTWTETLRDILRPRAVRITPGGSRRMVLSNGIGRGRRDSELRWAFFSGGSPCEMFAAAAEDDAGFRNGSKGRALALRRPCAPPGRRCVTAQIALLLCS
jgi:hypothetical protein